MMNTSPALSRKAAIVSWVAQLTAAAILGQTLFFKFTGAPESIYIFEKLGMEPVGRYGTGLAEMAAVALLLIPSLAWAGALLGLGVISGAVFFHLTALGIEVQGDGGLLFGMALATLVACALVLFLRRRHVPFLKS